MKENNKIMFSAVPRQVSMKALWLLVMVSIVMIVGQLHVRVTTSLNHDPTTKHDIMTYTKKGNKNDLIFTCPERENVISANDGPGDSSLTEIYDGTNKHHNPQFIRDASVEELRTGIYDGWDRSFNKLKEQVYDWKLKSFGENLKSGDSIFESACGEAYNLAMTLQILHDEKGIDNVKVYGNDYIEKSVIVGEEVLKKLAPAKTTIGSLCQGDSSNLDFVPSNSFDLVYTGYIDPLPDPIGIFDHDAGSDGDDDRYYETRDDLCEGAKKKDIGENWMKAKLVSLDQAAQEDWYAKWVSELVRIAKPGKPVLFEEVSVPICENDGEWGGVSKDWWVKAVTKYGWDVDEESIEFEQCRTNSKRYYVFMRKNV